MAVWKGKNATVQERRSALQHAVVRHRNVTYDLRYENQRDLIVTFVPQGFIKAKNYPPTTHVQVMNEGAESAMFKQLFKSWKEADQTQGLGKTYSRGKIGINSIFSHVTRLLSRVAVLY